MEEGEEAVSVLAEEGVRQSILKAFVGGAIDGCKLGLVKRLFRFHNVLNSKRSR